VFFYCKTNYEVFTPISLKTNNNNTPNYCIEHLHICVLSNGSKRIYIYSCILKRYVFMVRFKQINILVVYQGKLIYTM